MTSKKKPKRPPRQVWIVLSADGLRIAATKSTKSLAASWAEKDDRVVGPYVLAERVREK